MGQGRPERLHFRATKVNSQHCMHTFVIFMLLEKLMQSSHGLRNAIRTAGCKECTRGERRALLYVGCRIAATTTAGLACSISSNATCSGTLGGPSALGNRP